MSAFDQLHPSLQHHIVNSLGWRELRPLQELSIAPILAGRHCLLLAPTAGGKTESAVFPLMSRMLSEGWTGTSVLYVCPLKALLNNLHVRLEHYMGLVGRTCDLWHGDVTQARRGQVLRRQPDCLLTTPESLEAMLVSRRVDHRTFFAGLQAVVIDEIHAFAGDDRGWHLLAVLERLARLAPREPQRIGLSATVGNPDQLLSWLAGHVPGERVVVSAPTSGVLAPEIEVDHVGNLENAALVISRLHRGEKRLVFCDSRAKVEKLGAALHGLGVLTFLSHSSLSLDERQRTEAAFAQSQNCVIVATSTLELGIDVGDLDRVIQIDAPGRVASFLQRIGRTGRRPGTRRNCLFLATTDESLTQAIGLVELWREGFVEPVEPPALPLHLLPQQLMALALQENGIGKVRWQEWLLRLPPFRDLDAAVRESILGHLLQQEILHEDQGLLSVGAEGEAEYGHRHFSDLLSVFTTAPVFTVLHGQREIGMVDQSNFMARPGAEGRLALGGQTWKVVHLDWAARRAFVEPEPGKGSTRWTGGQPGLGFRLCQSIKRLLVSDQVPVGLSRRAVEALARIREEFAWISADETALVASNDNRHDWWTFAGARADTVLVSMLTAAGVAARLQGSLRIVIEAPWDKAVAALQAISGLDPAMTGADISDDLLDALKFSELLPGELARQVILARTLDRDTCAFVLRQSIKRHSANVRRDVSTAPSIFNR